MDEKELRKKFMKIPLINRMVNNTWDAHMVDIVIRHNGESKVFEADFIKDFLIEK